MRILHVCQPTDGGAAVVARQLVEAGVAAGDDVWVACPAGGFLAEWVDAAGATWHELPLSRSPVLSDLAHVMELRRLASRFDVIHAHSSKAGALVRIAALTGKLRGSLIVFTPHGWSWYVSGRSSWLYRLFERSVARWTDVITVVSRAELTDGVKVLGGLPKIRLIENGVDTDAYSPSGPVAERTECMLLVQIGRLSVQKGQDRSIRALSRLTDRSAVLRLIGSGPAEPELRELADSLGVADRVEFVGNDDPRPHLRASDLVVLPSRWEGMSLALLEAMSVGTCIISSDCGGSDALAGTGVIVERGGDGVVDQLVQHIDQLLADSLRREEMALAARRRAIDCYGLTDVIARYREVWRTPHSVHA